MKNLKPFDLQAALSGKAVMLRNGNKAYVRHHDTELPAGFKFRLVGFVEGGDTHTWGVNGSYLWSFGDGRDIIGMYPETIDPHSEAE